MKRICGNSVLPAWMGLLLGTSLLFLSACRSAPVAPPPTNGEPKGEQKSESSQTNLPAEAAKPSDTRPAQPPKQTVARLLPESLITAPAKDQAPNRVEYNTTISARILATSRKTAWQYRINRRGDIVGFEFSNQGGNSILPMRRDAAKNQLYTRDFQFRFDERARQDIHLMISDWVPSRDRVFRLSEIVNSVMLFFPRKFLPAIVNAGERNIVTLSTGEEVEFDAATHEVRGGVFSETPVDLNHDRQARRFPGIDYHGRGVVVRASARGSDPRIGTTASIISALASNCENGISCNQCQVPSRELWDQNGAARFKFASDTEFERWLIARCGFSLPDIGPEIAVK